MPSARSSSAVLAWNVTAEVMSGVCQLAYVVASWRKYCPSSAQALSGSSSYTRMTVDSPGIMQNPCVPASAHCS